MKCDICGKTESMPFKCNHCEGLFCYLHRLPPNHYCRRLQDYIAKKETIKGNPADDGLVIGNLMRKIGLSAKIMFSKTEIKHLLVATGLVVLVGLSLNNYRRIHIELILIFTSAFLVHELAHKFLAQFYGSWAEFRANAYGLMVTAISAIPFIPFKFIAPGAVMIGISDRRRFGRVALIGPLTNLVMGFGFLITSHFFPHSPYLYTGASFNGWIALFNLLPFGVLDGQKIFDWSKVTWLCVMGLSMGLFIIAYLR
ncbi:MAG TPA: AN1-type zinc finger domain-containing protein [Nitrososphaeraceae archaeon]|jgi:Zn-dependent protease|nr:AN1-type zinc finger domain-containing protein [Nitrososphaeraceae archaeon]